MNWLYLILSGLIEVYAIFGTRMLSRKKYVWGGFVTVSGFGAALYFLHLAMRSIDMSVAYAIYTGMGVVGTVLCGVVFWGGKPQSTKISLHNADHSGDNDIAPFRLND